MFMFSVVEKKLPFNFCLAMNVSYRGNVSHDNFRGLCFTGTTFTLLQTKIVCHFAVKKHWPQQYLK